MSNPKMHSMQDQHNGYHLKCPTCGYDWYTLRQVLPKSSPCGCISPTSAAKVIILRAPEVN